jgi:2-keto-4-pentenoate hydratase
LYVLGAANVPLSAVEPRAVAMRMSCDHHVVSAGTGEECLGDPLSALAWLARAAAGYGDPLRAGELVLSGALGPMVPVSAGSTYVAELSGLGEVRASFVDEGE